MVEFDWIQQEIVWAPPGMSGIRIPDSDNGKLRCAKVRHKDNIQKNINFPTN